MGPQAFFMRSIPGHGQGNFEIPVDGDSAEAKLALYRNPYCANDCTFHLLMDLGKRNPNWLFVGANYWLALLNLCRLVALCLLRYLVYWLINGSGWYCCWHGDLIFRLSNSWVKLSNAVVFGSYRTMQTFTNLMNYAWAPSIIPPGSDFPGSTGAFLIEPVCRVFFKPYKTGRWSPYILRARHHLQGQWKKGNRQSAIRNSYQFK